jgi:hypothetical protein
MRTLLVATSLALLAARSTAAVDCLAPLQATGWACHADLSTGETADFCLEHTNTFGAEPAARTFKINSTGLHLSSCICGAKGKSPGVEFGADKSMLCFDPQADTVTTARVSGKKIAGQSFLGSADVRSLFSCRPDPSCDVPSVVEPDLPAVFGAFTLALPSSSSVRKAVAAVGRVDVSYLSGCTGFASEAPTLTVDVQPTEQGQVVYWYDYTTPTTNAAGIVVRTPSGAVYCGDSGAAVPLEAGPHDVWLTSDVAGDTVNAELVAVYDY